jgi:hypothetical protein
MRELVASDEEIIVWTLTLVELISATSETRYSSRRRSSPAGEIHRIFHS